ncbi:MAG: hypothetical protein IKY67_06660 [Paludibacteraceae bacterium]|nr:hypothetical protein [Paludibacteraceae bacterium]
MKIGFGIWMVIIALSIVLCFLEPGFVYVVLAVAAIILLGSFGLFLTATCPVILVVLAILCFPLFLGILVSTIIMACFVGSSKK